MPIRGSDADDPPSSIKQDSIKQGVSHPSSSRKPMAPTPKPTVPSMRRPTPPPRAGARPSSVPPPQRTGRAPIYFPSSHDVALDAVDDESPPTVPRAVSRTAATATSLEAVKKVPSSLPPLASLLAPDGGGRPGQRMSHSRTAEVEPLSGYTMPPPPPPVSKLAELADALVGATFGERYQVGHVIGRGSNSLVFAAEAAGPHLEPTRIALKLLDPALTDPSAALSRLHAEVRALQILSSENVTRVYDVGIASVRLPPAVFADLPVPFIAMELLEGADLRSVLLRRGPLPAAEVTSILRQVAAVLDRAHGLGIVHRDLKPANLFLLDAVGGAPPVVKVLDFGVASLSEPLADESIPTAVASTTSRGFFGTPWYMAPEQIAGGPVTPAIDVWALGLIAFRLLTKESYWPPRPIADLLAEIVAGPRLLPTDVVEIRRLSPVARLGENFDAWFMRACEVAPAHRFRSVPEQIQALGHALDRDQ